MPKKVIRILLILLALLAVAYASYILYRVLQSEGYSSQLASGIATLGLVLITIWYAWSTGKLTDLTKSQIEATRATYAPNINVSIDFVGDNLEAEIENTGNGPAKSLILDFDIVHGETIYRYRAEFESDLEASSAIQSPNETKVMLTPKFRVQKVEANRGLIYNIKRFAFGEFDRSITGLSEINEYNQLRGHLRSKHENPNKIFLETYCSIRYDDILQEKEYLEKSHGDCAISLARDSLEEAISREYQVMNHLYNPIETRREYLRKLLFDGEYERNIVMHKEDIKTESRSIN